MDTTNLISVLIGGLGLGTLLNSVINHFFNTTKIKKEKLYQEKRDAYLGILNSLYESAVFPSDQKSKAYALWQIKCDVFGTKEVIKWAKILPNTVPGTPERNEAFDGLINAIRKDIGPKSISSLFQRVNT